MFAALLLAKAAATATKHSSSGEIIIVLYVVVFGGLYYFYLRPRRAKQAAARSTNRKVEVGDRAQTIGGFVGTVVNQANDLVTLRSESGVELDFIPSAIARKYEPVVHESSDDEPEAHEGESQEGDK
jgi:preprotein translocase subunit YajC